jgi:hypothetical protein
MPGSHHCQRTMSQSRDEVGGTTSREKRPLPGHFSDDIGGESLQQRCEFHREGGFEPPCAARAHESEETGSLWRKVDSRFLVMAARTSVTAYAPWPRSKTWRHSRSNCRAPEELGGCPAFAGPVRKNAKASVACRLPSSGVNGRSSRPCKGAKGNRRTHPLVDRTCVPGFGTDGLGIRPAQTEFMNELTARRKELVL